MFYTQRVPWPDHLSTIERNLKMLSPAFPESQVSITKPSSLFSFVQLDKKFLEESTKVKETNFVTIFRNKYMRKNRSKSKFASKLIAIHIAQKFPQF